MGQCRWLVLGFFSITTQEEVTFLSFTKTAEALSFGAGGKSHNSVFIHLAKPKRQTLTGDALFLFVGGRNRVYGRCGSSLQEKRKKHQQHQFCEEYRDIDLDLGSCKALCHECDILHEVKVSSRVPAN